MAQKEATYSRLLTKSTPELEQLAAGLSYDEQHSALGSVERRRKLRLIRKELLGRHSQPSSLAA